MRPTVADRLGHPSDYITHDVDPDGWPSSGFFHDYGQHLMEQPINPMVADDFHPGTTVDWSALWDLSRLPPDYCQYYASQPLSPADTDFFTPITTQDWLTLKDIICEGAMRFLDLWSNMPMETVCW